MNQSFDRQNFNQEKSQICVLILEHCHDWFTSGRVVLYKPQSVAFSLKISLIISKCVLVFLFLNNSDMCYLFLFYAYILLFI